MNEFVTASEIRTVTAHGIFNRSTLRYFPEVILNTIIREIEEFMVEKERNRRNRRKAMENIVEEYKKRFKPEKLELIVRISWCGEKGSGYFKISDNYYEVHARFDKALNVNTGELIEPKFIFHHLRWLVPKKILGFKYGYRLKAGKLYRILVREYISHKEDKHKMYYLEEVLEKDINIPQLDRRYSFESSFEEEVMDLTVLLKKRISAGASGKNSRISTATIIAFINNETNELNESCGTLAWTEMNRKWKRHLGFKNLGIYHVKVRKRRESNNFYLLSDVLKRVTDERLERIKEQYLKPVMLNSRLGEFKLDRDYSQFQGEINYAGEKCYVYMEVEEGETKADVQLDKLNEISSKLVDWDNNIREYISNELLELANDEWCEKEITKEQLRERISISSIRIYRSGSIEVMYDSDDIFMDHSIAVVLDQNGNYESVDIVG